MVRNQYKLSIIGKTIQNLEGFRYATVLYINMVYYTISILSASQDMTTIVTEFGKFKNNILPMCMWDYRYIFQDKVDKLLCDIKGVKTYIHDRLVLRKEIFYNHKEQLKIIFVRLRAARLKVNGPNYSFGLKEITYLCYIITREVIKADPKKLQWIIDLGRPTTTTDARAVIGMVKYYRDMWTRLSHILDTLTEAAISPKYRKYFGIMH